MALLTSQRNTEMLGDRRMFNYPVEANTNVYLGAMVALDANGNAVPAQPFGAAPLSALTVVGRADRLVGGVPGQDALNNPGVAGAISVTVRRGVFKYDNDGSIAQAQVGAKCFALDDHTVGASDGSGATVVPNTTEITFPAAAPLLVVLGGENIVKGSVIATSLSGGAGTVYVEGTDYLIDYQAGLITARAGGGIAASANVYITYKYGAPTRPVVGRVVQLDTDGVWVDFEDQGAQAV